MNVEKKKICPYCEIENKETTKFCLNCGRPIHEEIHNIPFAFGKITEDYLGKW